MTVVRVLVVLPVAHVVLAELVSSISHLHQALVWTEVSQIHCLFSASAENSLRKSILAAASQAMGG